MEKIKLLVMDVDGTLTDGKINMGKQGEVFKSFDIKDGYGIHEILPRYHIRSAIITGRQSAIVENRANELEIDFVIQGVKDKLEKVKEIAHKMDISLQEVAFIGDDMIDLICMTECGLSGCPADAVMEIKERADFVSRYDGGKGAVREFIEWLTRGGIMK